MSNRAAIYLIMGWVVFLVILALTSCAPARATRGCQDQDGCPVILRHGWQRLQPLPTFKTPEEAATARYMLERWPIEPIYRLKGE